MTVETYYVERFEDGLAIFGDSTLPELHSFIVKEIGQVPLIIADPPYGNTVECDWDKTDLDDEGFSSWMIKWTRSWTETCLLSSGAFYIWGGIGKPGFRPFMRYLCEVEQKKTFELANLITWKKKRGYGTQTNYLFTREECAYFTKGIANKPRCFHVPLLAEKRGYSGFNKKYPAKSDYYRRTNVWTDINELMQGKDHPTQKAQKLCEVMIEIHTDPGEYVLDPFGGAGTTAFAARKLGRKFVVIENDKTYFDEIVKKLKVEICTTVI